MLFGRRDERDEGGVFFVSGLEMVGDEVPDGSAAALQFGFVRQPDNQNVEFFVVGRRVCTKSLVTLDVTFEGVLDVSRVPLLRLGCVELVQQVYGEVVEARLVECLRKCLGNECAGLL